MKEIHLRGLENTKDTPHKTLRGIQEGILNTLTTTGDTKKNTGGIRGKSIRRTIARNIRHKTAIEWIHGKHNYRHHQSKEIQKKPVRRTIARNIHSHKTAIEWIQESCILPNTTKKTYLHCLKNTKDTPHKTLRGVQEGIPNTLATTGDTKKNTGGTRGECTNISNSHLRRRLPTIIAQKTNGDTNHRVHKEN